MKRALICLSGVLLLASVTSVQAQETTVVFQQGVNGYEGLSDLFIRSGGPDNNYEGRAEWEWDGEDGGVNFALFRFDDIIGTGENQIPPEAEIIHAELQTFISNSGSSDQFSTIYNLLVDWDPDTVTYNSIFGGEPVAGTHFAAEPSLQVFHDSAGNPWFADLTAHIQAFVDGMENKGFVIVPDVLQTNGFGHVASEAGEFGATSLTVETPGKTYNFEFGKDGYEGLQDAWVGNEDEDFITPFGEDVILDIDNNAVDDVRFGLIRFDNIFGDGPNQIPMGTEIISAQLKVVIVDTGSNPMVREILPHTAEFQGIQINTFFDEKTVTFENFVDDGFFPQIDVEVGAEVVAEIDGGLAGAQEVDVTSSVQKWSDGELENYGWILEPGGSGGVNMVAKEAALRTPKLVVTYTGGTSVEDYQLY